MFANCVGRVEIDYVRRVALVQVKDMPGTKNPIPKRQKGNRLVTAMAKNMGEQSLEEEPIICRLISSMSLDTNYLIRLDAAVFFKEYFQTNSKNLIGTPRLEEFYLPEICELLADEES